MPPGEAPEWVKQAFIGLEFPIEGRPEPSTEVGAVSGKVRSSVSGKIRPSDGYFVRIGEAIKILEAKNPKVAQWWRENSAGITGLIFAKDVCELI